MPVPSAGNSQQNTLLMIDLLPLPMLEDIQVSDSPETIPCLGRHSFQASRKGGDVGCPSSSWPNLHFIKKCKPPSIRPVLCRKVSVIRSQSRQKDAVRMTCRSTCRAECCPSCKGGPPSPGIPAFAGGAWERWPARLILPISATASSSGAGLKALYSSTALRSQISGAGHFIDRSGEKNSELIAPADHSNFHSFAR